MVEVVTHEKKDEIVLMSIQTFGSSAGGEG